MHYTYDLTLDIQLQSIPSRQELYNAFKEKTIMMRIGNNIGSSVTLYMILAHLILRVCWHYRILVVVYHITAASADL